MIASTGHLTLKDIAELAQVSRPAVSNWRKRYSDFPAPLENSAPRKPLFEATDVVAWLKANEFLPENAEKNLQLTGPVSYTHLQPTRPVCSSRMPSSA